MQISSEIKQQILDIIFDHLDRDRITVFLFGSYAQGSAKQYSDIDIGIFCNYDLNLSQISKIKFDLNEKVKTLRDIDLVNFDRVENEKFKEIALKEVIVWHQGKESRVFLNNM